MRFAIVTTCFDGCSNTLASSPFGLSMNISTAFNIVVRQSIREGGIHFDISLNQLNKKTISVMFEAERIAKDISIKD